MERAGITDPADVHYVQTKTPLLTIHTIRDAKAAARRCGPSTPTSRWTSPTAAPRSASRSRSARSRCRPTPTSCTTASLYSVGRLLLLAASSSTRRRSSWSATRRGVGGRYRIGHSVMKDALDADGIWDGDPGRRPRPARAAAHRATCDGRLVNVFLKCEASPGRPGARPPQRDARRLRRALAPPDQGVRRRRHRRRSPATRRCSCRSRRPTRAPTAAARSPRSSTSAEPAGGRPAQRPQTSLSLDVGDPASARSP